MVTNQPSTGLEDRPLYRAISDPTRRAILERLRSRGPSPAGELASGFDMSRPAVSKHLRLLREAKLVQEERQGRHRMYRLNAQPLVELDAWLAPYRLFWAARLHELKDAVENQTGASS